MSHIAIRTNDAEGWMFVQSTNYSDEAFLRDRIWDEPALIPVSEMGLPTEATMVPLKETSLPGAGSSDIILIDSLGNIVIVECKLATNPEKKRTVIGQVLDYASSLDNLLYEDLDTRVVKEHGRPLHELMEELVPAEEWDEDQFRRAVSDTISSGSFTLVIAIDKMDPDLARILHYVSSQGKLRIFGLELRYHKQDDVEVIIPHIANPIEVGAARSTTRGRMWTSKDFRTELDNLEDEKVRAAALDMLEFVLNQSDRPKWGEGETGNVFFQSSVEGKMVTVFYYSIKGAITFDWKHLRSKISTEALEAFVESLAQIRGFESVRENRTWQELKTHDTIMDKSAHGKFQEAVLAFQSSLST